MHYFFRGKRGGALVFLLIAILVAGGLAWVSSIALRVEDDQAEARARAELLGKLRLALWRLDSRVFLVLAREASRPYDQYATVYMPQFPLVKQGNKWEPGTVIVPSPLLNESLPPWVLLHFQVTEGIGWESPQLGYLDDIFKKISPDFVHDWIDPQQLNLLQRLSKHVSPKDLIRKVQQQEQKLVASLGDSVVYLGNTLTPSSNAQQTLNVEPHDPARKDAGAQPNADKALKEQIDAKSAPVDQKDAPAMKKGTENLASRPVQPSGPAAGGGSGAGAGYPGAPGGPQFGGFNPQPAPARSASRGGRGQPDANAVFPNAPGQQGADADAFQRLQQRREIEQSKQVYLQRDDKQEESKKNSAPVTIGDPLRVGPMTPLWLTLDRPQDTLIMARTVNIGEKQFTQGFVVDWAGLSESLAEEVRDLFPDARIEPIHEITPPHPERTMTSLPMQLEFDQTPFAGIVSGWTPLRYGLVLAWIAAVVALIAVALGGWTLIDLSERRIRFVSAVTHELRTPMTTLRLYLDMLSGGMVKEEATKAEYLKTLNTESERLNRLIGNVLDFSRLENQRPRLELKPTSVKGLLDDLGHTWTDRCRDNGKWLTIEDALSDDAITITDASLLERILSNLIDNSCKYSKDAEDPHVWVRVSGIVNEKLVFEVEDRGPGVTIKESRSIFRPFQRGRGADVQAGGVGLGLALAQRWAYLLGGKLLLVERPNIKGACFRLELPWK